MGGSLLGGVVAVLFFMLFQACGLVCAFGLLAGKSFGLRLLTGSVLGSTLLQWFPALVAFIFGFTVLSQWLALLVAVAIAVVVWLRCKMHVKNFTTGMRKPYGALAIVGILAYVVFLLLCLHSFVQIDGQVYSAQATYGDTSMHLGFITSIANQGVFPPEYSILPGTRLSYPFLCDSNSSSLYLLGASLPVAYFVPMLVAGAQLMAGVALFLRMWLKGSLKVLVAFLLFIFNGGFGFAYFLSGTQTNPENFNRIFTAFYETPTNLIGENIRFVNVIVDMLVPQRATLFGWAVLFTALCLLYQSIHTGSRRCFVLTGLLAGALPMIHTHSFLALGLISGTWLFVALLDRCKPQFGWRRLRWCLIALPAFMAVLQLCLGDARQVHWLLYLPIALLFLLLALGVYLVLKNKGTRFILPNWGLYLGITLVLALPQLFTWTLHQAQGEQFVRGYFNWGNINDSYLWFYIKNVGIPALLFIPAVLWAKKRTLQIIAPVFVILFVSELIVFQPNTYDNNKLIYIALFLVCGIVADYGVSLYRRLKGVKGIRFTAVALLCLCVCSAALTIGRESVAQYQLYNKDHMAAAAFIEKSTAPTDVVLTYENHNNAIAALTGRNIVCGSSIYVYYHGLDYQSRQADAAAMYQFPAESMNLFQSYQVDYILVDQAYGGTYVVNEEAIKALFPLAFESGQVRLYQVTEKESNFA